MENGYEYKIELNELFIDFRQTFDTVYRSKMIEILKLMAIPSKLTKLTLTHRKDPPRNPSNRRLGGVQNLTGYF